MVVVYASATAAINAPSTAAEEALTRSECWTALESICRDPVPHVNQISACRIVDEQRDRQGNLVALTRMIEGEGNTGEIEEKALLKRPVMIEFEFPKNGSFITSILASGKEKELYLTQMYEWHCPGVKEGSQEHWDRQGEYFQLAGDIVGHMVEQIRKMKEEGKLKEES
ncbi:hypothetical protein CERZMDRAFT_33440 [Cercospora zeae-maydis SCOH1-5]|uniref:Uncharacterized protein n=1 Tax=Cercospora zeae-maydis SCOH1-5 TaxID=717836 RepID=A0A6A6FRV9_9PEZI|nr:hypothetical protein CERZMDRAFT_33440 [Cercospora zeae-maydis SCOH1-5]